MTRGSRAKLPSPFRYFNSSPVVIRLVAMMYVRYPLSLRNAEVLLFERGIDICHETVRMWRNRSGPMFAADMADLWRAVDHEGEMLESYVTKTRDKAAALTFMKKALKRQGSPEAVTNDGLCSYGAAMKDLGNAEKQEVGRSVNSRVENSHLPFRRRELAMLRFRQMKSLQKFAWVYGSIQNNFNQERHLVDRQTTRHALAEW